MRKPIQVKIGFLRFLAKPLLIILLAGAFQLNVFAQISINVDACICLSNQSTPGDGQFQADITFAGFAPGETWYIAENEVDGLYHMASLDPPSNLIEFTTGPAGFTMTETSSGVYEMSGKHVDGQGFVITLTTGGPNSADSLEMVLDPGSCVYPEDPIIVGEGFSCEDEFVSYSVTANSGSTYAWSLSSGGSFTTPTDGTQVEVQWEPDNPGPHELSVTETSSNGCAVTDVHLVTVEDTIALACNNYVRVSLNIDCEGNLTADMFLEDPQFNDDSYTLLLETLEGVPLPGNLITPEYIGDTILVTVVHNCSGNFCQSFMVVEDKIDPEMNCIVDTVACDDSYAPEDIGFPVEFLTDPVLIEPNTYSVQGIDLCGPLTLEYEDDTIQNDCNNEFASYIVRRWLATDGAGNSSVCYDSIKTVRTGLSELVFPTNYDGLVGNYPPLESCGDWPQLPDGNPHPDSTGYPSGPLCGNLQIEFTDFELPICGSKSYKVVRKWFVMDWCTSEVFDTNQIIAIMDNDPPILSSTNDIEITTDNYECSATVKLPGPTVIYECSEWTYTVGYKLFDEYGNPPPLSDPYLTDSRVQLNPDGSYTLLDLPLGQTLVKYTVEDACDNSAEAFFEITVLDSLPPVAVCDQHTVVSLNEDGIGYAAAITFDDGSWDNCSEVSFKARRAANLCGVPANKWLDGLHFCCADIGQEVMVELQVTDAGGFTNTCMALVEVQDKRFPTVICPPDISVSCEFFISDYSIFGTVVDDPSKAKPIIIDDPGNPFTRPGYVWGYDGVAYDNCEVDVEIIFEGENINQCGIGIITRIFEIRDQVGNSTQCTQTIRVEDFDPFYVNENNPNDSRDDVIWPKDYVLHGCLDGDTDPDALPSGYDKPQFLDDDCSLIAYDYDDVVFQYVDGYCYKIVRTWTVIDWCQFDQTNPYGDGYWQYSQLIMVVDDELPQFTSGCETTPLVNQLNDSGCSATITFDGTATDNCTAPEDIKWNYEIDENNDGSVDEYGLGNTVTGNYAYGENKITWYIEDECGNVNSCSRIFIVEDNKKPTPVCYDGIVTVPMPTTGTVEIFAKSFNICNGCENGSFDNCTPQEDLIFSFSSDVTDVARIFSCADIANGILDTIDIEMWVTDLAGNQEFCNTHLILQDNQDICPDAAPEVYDLAGMVLANGEQAMQHVEVTLESAGQAEYPIYSTTNSNGVYSFNDVLAYRNYQMTASSNADPMGGISTLDLVLIQKHLLGLNPLDDPYAFIAADVNGTGSISAADLLDLRKLILGIHDELPNNDSWRFVDQAAGFEHPENPFPLDEVIELEGLRFHSVQNNFVGIKIGDVNNSNQFSGGQDLEGRNLATTTLITQNISFNSNEVLEMDVYSTDIRMVEGMQFTVKFNPLILEFMGVEGSQFSVSSSNYNTMNKEQGLVTFSWNANGPYEMNANAPLMTLTFKSLDNGDLSDAVEINSTITQAEVYYDNGDELYATEKIELRFDENLLDNTFKLFQNTPNPFSHETRISYFLNKEFSAVLNIYDVDGKLVHAAVNLPQSGIGVFTVDSKELNLTEGIYYYSLKAGDEIATRKMIIIR